MAEFQWWLLIVGLVAGGGLVAVVYMDARRRDVDVEDDELLAEANWIATRVGPSTGPLDAETVAAVLRSHREYLTLPPPDRLEPIAPLDSDADRPPDGVGDGRGSRPDEDLPTA